MKTILLLTLLFSTSAFANIKITKFEILKVLDGKVQNCLKKPDSYKAATYKTFSLYQGQPVVDSTVNMFVILMGQLCHEIKLSNGKFDYIWLSHDLFKEYNHPIFIDQKEEYVTIIPSEHKLKMTTQAGKLMGSFDLLSDPAGASSLYIDFELEKGISPNFQNDFENGKSVKSVFFLYMQTRQHKTYSWSDREDNYLYSGPAYSFVFDIIKD